jgi:TIR domain
MGETKRIFVSHKSTNAKLASDIIEILESEMKDVDFFLSEKINPGENWRTDIVKALRSAECMLLLYLDPDQDWGWCLFEAGLFSAHRSKDGERPLYCIQYPGAQPPDPLSDIQTTSATPDSMKTFLASLYNTTKQIDPRTWANLDATALRLVDLLENGKPKRQDVTYLRPSVLLYPAWIPAGRPDWRPFKVPKALPLDRSEVVIENQLSLYQLGFNTNPKRMNVLKCFKRLDVDGSDVKRPWIDMFLDSLQSTLEDRITDQHVVYFRAMRGNILRPIIESITRSDDGSECVCRVVFVDAFAPPSSGNPSRMQLLANGLRLAVRTRLEVLDKYRGVMAQERSRLAQSQDPAEALGKLHPLGARILESMRTIILEAELQGSNFNAPPANLFHDDPKQATYERLRDKFKSWMIKFQTVSKDEDNEPEGKYIQTEQLLDELDELHRKYIAIAAPTFLNMLEASHKQPNDPNDDDPPVRSSQNPSIGEPSLSAMRETVGTLCSVIEASALGRGASSAPGLR